VLHTGDLTHLSKPAEFDTLQQVLGELSMPVFYVPGEHDVLEDDGKSYLQRFGKGTQGAGWHSFDQGGIHFIGLVNVVNLKAGGLGSLGAAQLEWLEQDVKRLKSSTPIVVFAHIPLWSVYPEWGWGTDDSERALAYLKRFGSVSVLNGHIHQVMQKVEGHVSFHTAMSPACPQPAPGSAPSPGPMKVEAARLKKVLGLSRMSFHDINHPIAITDVPLEEEMKTGDAAGHEVVVDNFSFAPAMAAVPAGSTITWTNRDDVPHNIVSTEQKFKSPVLDTDERFSHKFDAPGTYKYYCSIHPKMTGQVVVS
jgi:plastocyanin